MPVGGGPSLDSFRLVRRIADGGFGFVDEGVGPNGELVAIKREVASRKVTRGVLEHEYHVYKTLAGHFCIPEVIAHGRRDSFNLLVMDLLGPSLGDRFQQCSGRFSLATTARLALGMLDAIEYMHSRGFIHRDIKPENFLLGLGAKSHVVHLIDFGFARRWKHSTIVTYVSSSTPEEGFNVIGTLRYASKYAHLGQAQTRRDDLHALVYTILLFARGSLPWDHIRRGTEKHCARRILEKKRSWTAERLCQGLPRELESFSSYCLGLEISEEPDYRLLRDNLTVIANREGCGTDIKFEWDDPDWIGECCFVLSAPSRLNMSSAAPITNELAPPLPEHIPMPRVKRGDIVLLKISLEKSLDYEPSPRALDLSFFPHQNLIGMEWRAPYRPAVVRKVILEKNDPTYFTVEVYPLMRRSGLTGLSTRRCRNFLPLETLIDITTGIQVPSDNMFVYKSSLLNVFKIEYDSDQAKKFTSPLSVPECTLANIETILTDDEEPRRIKRDMHGWISEMIQVEDMRNMENGESLTSDDDDSDVDINFWDFPQSIDRRLSCTVQTSISLAGEKLMVDEEMERKVEVLVEA